MGGELLVGSSWVGLMVGSSWVGLMGTGDSQLEGHIADRD
jgi:hypothetical protein